MWLKRKIMPWISELYLSNRVHTWLNFKNEYQRKKHKKPHLIRYFHQTDDPYSHLVSQLIKQLTSRYHAVFEPILVNSPPDWAAPERDHLIEFSRRDAAQIAPAYGLAFEDAGTQPDMSLQNQATAILAKAIQDGCFFDIVSQVSTALWAQDHTAMDALSAQYGEATAGVVAGMKQRGSNLRQDLGHYLGATFHYGGDWYWGLDRLHYLECRLHDLGAYMGACPFQPLCPPLDIELQPLMSETPQTIPSLEMFFSFRSPYSYLAAERAIRLARHYKISLNLRFVLPMVMRGLPVPRAKSLYIMKDCKREATRLDLPFGRVSDPVGQPVERGLSLLPAAIKADKGEDYILSFLKGVWSEGIDAGTDGGLSKLINRAGLSWKEMKSHLNNPQWREEANMNREAMFALGLWGVPSFKFGNISTWGQDRLWVIEREILKKIKEAGT